MSEVDVARPRERNRSKKPLRGALLQSTRPVDAVPGRLPGGFSGGSDMGGGGSPQRDQPSPRLPRYTKSKVPLRDILRQGTRPRFRGVPPPFPFDIDALPDSTLLNETEVAAIIRRSKSCVENWRKYPDHPLQWQRAAGRVLYRLGSVREFLKDDADKQKVGTEK
jgi:hypothetical protein